jgi:hypothetical protein
MLDGYSEQKRRADINLMWCNGDLSFLMHDGQQRMRDQFHAWRMIDQLELTHEDGALPLVFAVEGGKRFGKTTGALWIAHELAVWFAKTFRRPAMMRYTSAFQKTIDEIIGSVAPQVFETAPPSCEAQYHGKRGPLPAGFYWPTQGPTLGARLALAGLDMNKNALRGQGNDFDFISEAAFIDKLDYTVRNVLIHQYHQRPWSRMMVETSAPEVLGTDWEMTILPDARARGAVFSATIEDNPRLSRREKDFWIGQAGGRGHPNCEREYFNVISASPEQQVIPEFNEKLHIADTPRPRHAIAMAAMDPGMRDLFAIIWGYWDAARAKLVVERDWAQRNASTAHVAQVIGMTEAELYGGAAELGDDREPTIRFGLQKPNGLCWWDGTEFRANPVQRISDTEARLIGDLTVDYDISVMNTLKDDKEAALYALRNAFRDAKIEIHPRCTKLISHVRTARWNDNRTDYERTPQHGHYDLLDALVYLWRMMQPYRSHDPFPPAYIDRNDRGVLFHQPPSAATIQIRGLQEAFGGRRANWR